MSKNKYFLWEKQSKALRDPYEVLTGNAQKNGVYSESLEYQTDSGFLEVLTELQITLLLTREYEHLVLSLNVVNGTVHQKFLHLPHPSGLAVDRRTNTVYVAATRNPNQIWELRPSNGEFQYLMPTRTKVFPGSYYFHDLAMIGDRLFGTSVGKNAVVEIDFNSSKIDEPVWWPKSIEQKIDGPDFSLNYLQLNSIAAGTSIEKSFFSASSAIVRAQRPGDLDYPVDRNGVIFSGKTREVYATGLTRPHSARIFKDKVWVDDSGYGTLGYIESGKYVSVFDLPGWTRGLCFIGKYAFVGVSRVLPKFRVYAPGLEVNKCQTCGIFVYDTISGEYKGSIVWPYGNQIFAIEYLSTQITQGFIQENPIVNDKIATDHFYKYKIK